MITKQNFKNLLIHLGFEENKNIFNKKIRGHELKADFNSEKLIYPNGLTAQRETTKNFSQPENFVVFECVHNLLISGYLPEHIILEQGMPGGHGMTGGFCDIIVQDNDKNEYLLIECKTADDQKSKEFTKAWNKMLRDGGQLFNYYNSYRKAKWICLYASDFDENNDKYTQHYHLISMQDNNDYLESNPKLRSFRQVAEVSGGKEEYFKVWNETYQSDFISHNLFESEIFKIGNRPYNIHDLKKVDNDTIQKKYHQFATIMRQHNISGRENAFDKLVNLFLCKVVDEKHNPNNLKVYWRGASSDNHYDFQDRLQSLYKIGMQEFLNEEVTYIEEEKIENAFHLFKNRKDETKKVILDYFKQLKFYSNNAFAFLDVHNEDLFLQNAIILKEVVQMLQDIRLKNEDEQHQFLGDLFEGFLDQGVKQSEGQFFTPMPIVKFLVSSLPLPLILEKEETPKVIDYACGAGHFLTEYASQIKDILGTEQQQNLKNHYANIYGIEKEYRLSKVAKVSAFMYGQDEINIIYADALAKNERITDNQFSVLIANPPYSVKGFLATLSEEDKAKFELYDNLTEESFNSIETFFIEKAKQLLKSDGVAAIVLPSSILTNGNIYIKCREIILKYFDLVAIAEFGSGTFGKTGTNTATLFLRRKAQKPDIAEHYKNRVEAWFKGDFDSNIEAVFADSHLLKKYCEHCGFDFEGYQNFLQNSNTKIFENEIFKEYRREFENSTDIKQLKTKKFFKDFSDEQKQQELHKRFIQFAKNIESEKVYFYLLAMDNKTEILVVKSPADNKKNKEFLGYEWSSAKGNEGIKYLGSNISDEEENIHRNQGIYQIQTPLFNPNNLNDESKINTLIRRHFMGENIEISEQNKAFVSLLPLTDMLDFSRTSFDKAIRTSIQKKVEIKSKFPLERLENICQIEYGIRITKKNTFGDKYPVYGGGGETFRSDEYNRENQYVISRFGMSPECVRFVSGKFFLNDSGMTIKSKNEKELITFFVEIFLYSQQENVYLMGRGSAQKNIDMEEFRSFKIPLPPLSIQEEIVKECEKIDAEYENSRMSVEAYRAKIAQIFHDLEVLDKNAVGGVVNC